MAKLRGFEVGASAWPFATQLVSPAMGDAREVLPYTAEATGAADSRLESQTTGVMPGSYAFACTVGRGES